MDTERIKIEDTPLIDALITADRARLSVVEGMEVAALRRLAEEVRRHVSGPASCAAVRGAEAERHQLIEAEARRRIGNIIAELKGFEAEFYRLNAVCDSRTEGN